MVSIQVRLLRLVENLIKAFSDCSHQVIIFLLLLEFGGHHLYMHTHELSITTHFFSYLLY